MKIHAKCAGSLSIHTFLYNVYKQSSLLALSDSPNNFLTLATLCIQYLNYLYLQVTAGVHLPASYSMRQKRESLQFEPMRILFYYDNTVNTE